MKNILTLLVILFPPLISFGQVYMENKTFTYAQTIAEYERLDRQYPNGKLMKRGHTDVGKPLHLFVITNDGNFHGASSAENNKRILLVNNAIHAGEPCGVDASIQLAEDLLNGNIDNSLLNNVVICIIPGYNVGGMLNRNSTTRTGQNGPEEYGFRGNAKNLDLNRDFIKCDSKNAISFTRIFHEWNPDVFIDTHTTNGTDYQYNMSIITTQPDKLTPALRDYVRDKMNPAIYSEMKKDGFEIIPYVSAINKTPDDGFKDYLETPRYSTGYTALFNTIGYVTEAHKYKPYKDRVEYTYQFILKTAQWMSKDREGLRKARAMAISQTRKQSTFDILWTPDTNHFTNVEFKGYTAVNTNSAVSGNEIHYYDYNKPFTKSIQYFDRYQSIESIDKPIAYIIPQAYSDVTTLLQLNGIKLNKFRTDTVLQVEVYYIVDYQTVKTPYEAHYLHYNIETVKETQNIQIHAGDWMAKTTQVGNRYLIETLEPKAHDSFFAWNYFDGILQQKEWFSSWHFDKEAAEILAKNPVLQSKFDAKKREDNTFAEDHFSQLYFIYKNSPHYEISHNRYPVYRLIK